MLRKRHSTAFIIYLAFSFISAHFCSYSNQSFVQVNSAKASAGSDPKCYLHLAEVNNSPKFPGQSASHLQLIKYYLAGHLGSELLTF